jgi:GTP-binding protein Era
MSEKITQKFGTVAIIGRPNVGKSTLLNSLLNEKITIVSHKPNTTRTIIKGIKTTDKGQIVFIDTPGIHNAKDRINNLMVQQAIDSLSMVDLIYFMIDINEQKGKEITKIISILNELPSVKFLLINKVDITNKNKALIKANEFFGLSEFKYVLPISAKKNINIDKLIDLTFEVLPEGNKFYDDEEITTIPEKFLVAEFVREQIFCLLRDEVPYDVVVECEKIEDRKNEILYIAASIIVNRESQKGIIIGKQGSMLKEIGKNAREYLEKFFGVKVYLDLWVKIRNNWKEKDEFLKIQGLL